MANNTSSTDDCLSISLQCPVEATIYGYYPSLPANAFAVAVFAICLIVNVALGCRYKTWTYLIAVILACSTSTAGYAGRIIMHDNPWDGVGFKLQAVTLTFSPAFNAAAVYLMLKHIVLRFGPECSRLRPRLYTWVFILADFFALVLQASGGGIAATSDDDKMTDVGDGLMIAGIAWQVVTLVVFGGMIVNYVYRRSRSLTALSTKATSTLQDTEFKIFAGSLAVIYVFILIRCVYRIAEMAGGWRNSIMQNQGLFIGLDTVLMCIATLLQTFVHPGIFFPAISETSQQVTLSEIKGSSGSSVSTV